MILITYSHLYIVIYTFFQHMKTMNITKHANHAQKINKKPPGPFPLHWGAERADFHKPSADRSKAIQTRKQGSSAAACFSVHRLFCPGAVVICEKKSQMQQKAMARNCFLANSEACPGVEEPRCARATASHSSGSCRIPEQYFLGNRCRFPNCLS